MKEIWVESCFRKDSVRMSKKAEANTNRSTALTLVRPIQGPYF